MNTELASQHEAGVVTRQDFSGVEVMRGAETAMAAMAAQSKALVEARFVVAMRQPRNWQNIRIAISHLCKDPGFAAEALYVKPLTATPDDWQQIDKRERLQRRLEGRVKDWPMGFSIRFVEAALFECGNFDCNASVVWEDAEKRITVISVLCLERNRGYTRTLVTQKTVERSYLKKSDEPISVRQNSNGQMVYVLAATPSQIETAEAAGVSKAIRTLGEKMLPPHFKAEWRKIIEETILNHAAKDPEAAKNLLLDNFAEKGVLPDAIEAYIGHPIETAQPAELVVLRKLFVAITNGEITWREVMEEKLGTDGETKPTEGAKKVADIVNAARREAVKPAPVTAPAPAPQPQPVAETIEPLAEANAQERPSPPANGKAFQFPRRSQQ